MHSIVTRSSNSRSDSPAEGGLIPFLIDDNVSWAAEIHRCFCVYDINPPLAPVRAPKPTHRIWTCWYGASKTISRFTRTTNLYPAGTLIVGCTFKFRLVIWAPVWVSSWPTALPAV